MPANVVELKGADKVNPGRFTERKASDKAVEAQTNKLGRAPGYFDSQYREIWDEMRERVPWLRDTDAYAVELLCRIMYVSRYDYEHLTAAQVSCARGLLAQLGMTPVDRAKINITAEPSKEDDPWSKI